MTNAQLPVPPKDGDARIASLAAYVEANRETYTPDALAASARASGYTETEIEAALVRAGRIASGTTPHDRARARRLVLVIYAATYLVFAFLFLRPESSAYGAGPIALIILAVSMGLMLLLSFWSIRRSSPRATTASGIVTALLVGPLILLVAVSGLCVATTAPMLFR
jgi:hypothetical protein